jgi:predicted nucleic acid-binding protein
MYTKLLNALMSVSATSKTAKALADRVLKESESDLVRQLHDQVQKLQQNISELRVALKEEEPLSDAEALEIADEFTRQLATMEWSLIQRMNRSYFKQYRKEARLIMATALKNYCVTNEKTPNDLWLDLIALGGELK